MILKKLARMQLQRHDRPPLVVYAQRSFTVYGAVNVYSFGNNIVDRHDKTQQLLDSLFS